MNGEGDVPSVTEVTRTTPMESLNDDLAGKNGKPQEKSSADGKNMFKRVFNSFRIKPKVEGVTELARENRALQYKNSQLTKELEAYKEREAKFTSLITKLQCEKKNREENDALADQLMNNSNDEDEEESQSVITSSKLSFTSEASHNTCSISSFIVNEKTKEDSIHPGVAMTPHGELKFKANGDYRSFSFFLDSKDIHAFRVTCKGSHYRIILNTGFTNVGSAKLIQVIREPGPIGVTHVSIDFVKKRTGDMRMAACIMEKSLPDFTFEYAFNAQ